MWLQSLQVPVFQQRRPTQPWDKTQGHKTSQGDKPLWQVKQIEVFLPWKESYLDFSFLLSLPWHHYLKAYEALYIIWYSMQHWPDQGIYLEAKETKLSTDTYEIY